MIHLKKTHYLLAILCTITSHTIICMENPNQDNQEQQEENKKKEAAFNEKMAQAKENTYIRDNSIQYRMVSNMGDHAARGLMEFLAQSASGAVTELVKRELDIRYDNDPTVARQLEEIASGITIIHNAVNLTDDLAKKQTAMAKYLTANNPAEQKNKTANIDTDVENTYLNLRNLRNEHIDQLNAIRKKRNPKFEPYSAK